MMSEESCKILINHSSSPSSITPFSINDILKNKSSTRSTEKDDDELQEKALDMSKANKTCKGKTFVHWICSTTMWLPISIYYYFFFVILRNFY